MLHHPIQRKLSALLGADVRFDKLNLSLLGGSIEALGVSVSAGNDMPPVLTIARVFARVAMARALKGEILITSLEIEKPLLTVVRRSDGTTNLPSKLKPDSDLSPASPPDESGGPTEKSRWKLDVEKVRLVDGYARYREESTTVARYEIASDPIRAELTRAGGGFAMTMRADNLRRTDTSASLGAIAARGSLDNAADLTSLNDCALSASLEIADVMTAEVRSPSPRSGTFDLQAYLHTEAQPLIGLLPPRLLHPILTGLRGQIEINLTARRDAAGVLRLSELTLRAGDGPTEWCQNKRGSHGSDA